MSEPVVERIDKPPQSLAPRSGELSDIQINRLASIIADGRGTLPEHLSPLSAERIAVAVKQQLRHQLLRLIARAIAASVKPPEPSETEINDDART